MKIAVLTVWQPWADLIAEGFKPHEFRAWHAHRHHHNTRIGIHAGTRPVHEEEVTTLLQRLRGPDARLTGLIGHERCIEFLSGMLANPTKIRRSELICTAKLHAPLRSSELLVLDPRFRASDLAEGVDDNGPYIGGATVLDPPNAWAWPLTAVRPLVPSLPMRGAQGFWRTDVPDDHFTAEELA